MEVSQEWIKRFNAKWKLDTENGCWIWQGAKLPKGYGIIKIPKARRQEYAHRLSWVIARGAIPDGKYVLHRCDTPSCVNPEHLFLGDAKANSQDMKCKGRHLYGENNSKAVLVSPDVEKIKAMLATGKFSQPAIAEVYKTLIEAGILVLIVILVFLQDWRAMLVPATTVPVTLIGAFAAMAALGFSANLPTLFALVLAIGIVVDDAIIIVEGVARYIEQGMPGREAAGRAMDELTGPVLGITLVLMSVFIPAAFLAGFTGQLYRQFALVIAATAFISAVNALTLKPTQCALWLRPPKPREQRNIFSRGFDAGYGALEHGYTTLVGAMTRRAVLMVVLALALVGVAGYGLSRVPTAFLPTEDQGYLITPVQLPDGASKERTDAVLRRIQPIAGAIPGVDHVVTVSGISVLDNMASLANAGVAFVVLKDWDERLKQPGQDARSIGLRLNGALQDVPQAIAFALPPPPIQGIGNVGGFTMQVELKSGNFDYALLQSLTNAVVANSNAQSALQRVATTYRAGAPQFFVNVDRIKAERIGVTVGQVFSALSDYIGANYVAQFNKFGHVFQIYTQAEAKYRVNVGDLRDLKVKAGDGTMTPIGPVVDS